MSAAGSPATALFAAVLGRIGRLGDAAPSSGEAPSPAAAETGTGSTVEDVVNTIKSAFGLLATDGTAQAAAEPDTAGAAEPARSSTSLTSMDTIRNALAAYVANTASASAY